MLRVRHLPLALLLAVGCGSDPDPIGADSGADASLDAKLPDAKSDAPKDGAPQDSTVPDASPPDGAAPDASDAAVPCNGSTTGQCGPGMYCNAVACGLGTCAVAPAESSNLTPICGCDGVTYWNVTVAQNHGVSTASAGECKPGKMCGGFANIKCPAGTKCNFKQTSQSGCLISDPSGECWGVPVQCPQIVIGPQTRQCGQQKCTEQCTLIKQGVTYYDDNTCPQ